MSQRKWLVLAVMCSAASVVSALLSVLAGRLAIQEREDKIQQLQQQLHEEKNKTTNTSHFAPQLQYTLQKEAWEDLTRAYDVFDSCEKLGVLLVSSQGESLWRPEKNVLIVRQMEDIARFTTATQEKMNRNKVEK